MNKIYYKTINSKQLKQQLNKLQMGIDGLLTLLKPLIKKQHISTFRNKTIGVDALPWIYKGLYGATLQMGESINENQNAFLYYIVEMIDMLQFYNIKPIFVFDGKSLQAKYKTLEKRKKAKQQSKKKAEQHLENEEQEKSKKAMARCMNIDEAKLCQVMSLLESRNIQFVVAPYEADSQICKLFKLGIIEAVVTEDSDLVVYGVDVILKLKQTGQCDFLTLKKDEYEIKKQECPFLRKFCLFQQQKRVQSAILAGCDYVDSVRGIGIKKAIKLVQQNEGLDKIVQALQKDPKLAKNVSQDYLELVHSAKFIFLFARTYNPKSQKLEYLSQELQTQLIVPESFKEEQFQKIIGAEYQFKQSQYKGKINCKTQSQRVLKKIDMKLIYSHNRENVNFENQINQRAQQKETQSDKNEKQKNDDLKNQLKECIIDQTTSICWEGDSMNQGLAFLLQKELVERFFSNPSEQNLNADEEIVKNKDSIK